MLAKIFSWILFTGLTINMTACSPYVEWKEEVKLNDGRVIVVEQKRRMEGQISRETWMTINLPEFSSNPILWHENLAPLVVNVSGGELYVVGDPPTAREISQYGKQTPFYIGFKWQNGSFKRIPFDNIPETIYSTNMLIPDFPPNGESYVNLDLKLQLRKTNPPYPPDLLRINPAAGCFC